MAIAEYIEKLEEPGFEYDSEEVPERNPENDEKLVSIIEEKVLEKENPELFFSEDFSKFLRDYLRLPQESLELLEEALDKFAKDRFGVPMEEETKRVLTNQYLYIPLGLLGNQDSSIVKRYLEEVLRTIRSLE